MIILMEANKKNVDKAKEYVARKKPGNQYVMGAKGEPGDPVDCSGVVSDWVRCMYIEN